VRHPYASLNPVRAGLVARARDRPLGDVMWLGKK